MKIPDTPIGPTAPLPGSGSGVLQKASDYADPNAGKELVPKELIEAVKADEERKQTLEVVAAHNTFADAERQMLDQVRKAEGKAALGGLDEPPVYDRAKEWYDKQAQAAIDGLGTDRQKLLMTKMVGANRDKGLDSVSLHQAHQQKVYTASVAQGAVEAAAQAAGQKWGDTVGVHVEVSKALAAIDALHPGQDNTAQKIKAEAHIYGSVMGLALANGQADNYGYLKTLLDGPKGDGEGGFKDKLTPEARAHYITALREQQKNTTNMRTYATVMAEAGNNPSKALAMFTPAYAEKNGLDGGTWEHVSSLLAGKINQANSQQAHARAMANEDASKYVLDLYIKHNGVIPPEVAMDAARSGKLRGEMAMRLVEGAAKMTSGIEKDSAQFRMIQASADGTLSPSMVLENASRLGPEQAEHWMKQADPKSPASGINQVFTKTASEYGVVFHPDPKGDNEKASNKLWNDTYEQFQERLKTDRKDPRGLAKSLFTEGIIADKKSWYGGSIRITQGEAQRTGKPFLFIAQDSSSVTPTQAQLGALGLPADKNSAIMYFGQHGEDALVLRQGVIEFTREANKELKASGRPVRQITAETYPELERAALRFYGAAALRQKGLAAWNK